jgi:hypothetical protein
MYMTAKTPRVALSLHARTASKIIVNNICQKVNDEDSEMN